MKKALNQFEQRLSEGIQERKKAQLFRQRYQIESPQSHRIKINGLQYINFSSNNYLGLANHPKVIASFQQASNNWGVGSGASHLISGHQTPHCDLENRLADFLKCEAVLLFSCGYMANLACLTALVKKKDVIFADKLNHASLIDGAIQSQSKMIRYHHADHKDLANKFNKYHSDHINMIVTDAVFSMDGDLAPLAQLCAFSEKTQSPIMVDDAHGFGVLGPEGQGSCHHMNLANNITIYMATLGKASGTAGAFVAGSKSLIENLIQYGRSYIYTTAMPAAIAAASITSLKLLQKESWRRHKLQELIEHFKCSIEKLGFDAPESNTAILPIIIGDNETTMYYHHQLKQQGFYVGAIRPPTVPPNKARLRISLTAEHSKEDIDALITAIANIIKNKNNIN